MTVRLRQDGIHNPRWLAFIDSNPAKVSNIEYMCWIGERWTEWRTARGLKSDDLFIGDKHADFDAWLAQHVYGEAEAA